MLTLLQIKGNKRKRPEEYRRKLPRRNRSAGSKKRSAYQSQTRLENKMLLLTKQITKTVTKQ